MDWSATLLPFLINEMKQEIYDLEVEEETAYEVKKVKKKVNVIPEFSSTLTKKLVL